MQKYAAYPSSATASRVSKGFKDELGIESIFVCLEILPISQIVRVKAAAEGYSDARCRRKMTESDDSISPVVACAWDSSS